MTSNSRPLTSAEKLRAYRQRQAAVGNRELTVVMPENLIAYLDNIKAQHRLSSRSQAVMLLIEQGRLATQKSA